MIDPNGKSLMRDQVRGTMRRQTPVDLPTIDPSNLYHIWLIHHQPGSPARVTADPQLPSVLQTNVRQNLTTHPRSLLLFLLPSTLLNPLLVIVSLSARVHDRKRLTDR
jgi:hypothetical protein